MDQSGFVMQLASALVEQLKGGAKLLAHRTAKHQCYDLALTILSL